MTNRAKMAQEEFMEKLSEWMKNSPCDAGGAASMYMMPDGTVSCRCIVCGRCERHTGNSHQGHFWKWCRVTKDMREFHFCCPDNCELEEKNVD